MGEKSGSAVLGLLLEKSMWFEKSVSSGAELYFFDPEFPSEAAIPGMITSLVETVSVEKAKDFPSIGKLFSTGSLGFLHGGVLQAKAAKVTNTATLNFAVHGFQESYAYIFFSPLGTTSSDVKGVYKLYAFALNMLIRRYASIADSLCGATITASMKAACASVAAIYPPVKMSAAGVPATTRPTKEDLVAMKTGFRKYLPQDDGSFLPPLLEETLMPKFKILSPPLENMGLMAYEPAHKLVLKERDVDLDTGDEALDALGTFVKAADPTVPVKQPCSLMMSKISERNSIQQVSEIAAVAVKHKEIVSMEAKFLDIFAEIACYRNKWLDEECSKNFQAAYLQYLTTPMCKDPKMCFAEWPRFLEEGLQGLGPRRLSDVIDAALPSVRSATASSALPQDGTPARVGARRLSKGSGAAKHVDKYKEMVKEYSECIEAIPTSKCATNLATMSSDDAKVTAFYSKTGLVTTACAGIITPSDCPVDMFSKEVSFMWGTGTISSTHTRSKTSSYVVKGLPAASRLDRMMNFVTELFAA